MEHEIGMAMLIDDEEIDRRSYQRVLNRSGLVRDTLMFTYAFEALEYLRENPDVKIDVIFLDINMPRMDGFEFLEIATRELGRTFAKMVVVMLTTSIDPIDQKRAEDNPLVRGFFDKPLTVPHIEMVAKMLSNNKAGNAMPPVGPAGESPATGHDAPRQA